MNGSMKSLATIGVLGAILVGGCEKPSTVEGTADDNALEVSAVSVSDTNYVAAQFDSAGVLPTEQLRFAGRLILNRVTHDAGANVRVETFSRVLFEDRDRPVIILNRVLGFHGMNLGTVVLQGNPMNAVPHRIPLRRLPGDSVIAAGIEYLLPVQTYQPQARYTWDIPAPDSLSPFTASIISPDVITVQSPRGGSTVYRNRDLRLRWTGSGRFLIIISGFDPLTRRTRPFLRLSPQVNNGTALLGSRVLNLLPARFRFYVFTFVLANRDESTVVAGFHDRILVQAATMYNSYVELQ